jgi:hypothetical protein
MQMNVVGDLMGGGERKYPDVRLNLVAIAVVRSGLGDDLVLEELGKLLQVFVGEASADLKRGGRRVCVRAASWSGSAAAVQSVEAATLQTF